MSVSAAAAFVKPSPAAPSAGEFAGGLQIHAGQIANRGVVFGSAQAAKRNKAGIACPRLRFRREQFTNSGNHLPPFAGSGLRAARRRHIAYFQMLYHALPRPRIGTDCFQRGEALQIKAAPLCLRGMTGKAILLHQRQQRGLVNIRRVCGASRLAPQSAADAGS